MFWIYILRSFKNQSYYVGYSENVGSRLLMHNAGKVKATRYLGPLEVVYTEVYNTATEARKREYYIKRQKSRRFIEDLMNNSVGN